jgi:hypothetical protein
MVNLTRQARGNHRGNSKKRDAFLLQSGHDGEDCDVNYEEVYFRERFLHIVAQHDPSQAPLFLYYAPHLVHDPLEVWHETRKHTHTYSARAPPLC